MALEIRQTYAQIGIDRRPSNLEMQSEKARLLLHQKQAKVDIHTELPKVIIDQYECFASAGLKGNFDRALEISQRTYQQVLDFIGKTAEDGDALTAIENGGNPIAQQAVRDAWPQHEFGLDFLPKVGPKIDVVGDIQMQAEPNAEGVNNGVEGQYIPGSLNMNYTPAKVSVYMARYPSISIFYTGRNVDLRL